MSDRSKIDYVDASWNPVTGCSKVSTGCLNCFAKRFAKRLQAMGKPRYAKGFEVTCHDDLVNAPLRWRKPRMIFVCSMSDLFHEKVPFEFIDEMCATMAICEHHTFQILTKRSERMADYARRVVNSEPHDRVNQAVFDPVNAVHGGFMEWPLPNVWLGVTVENQDNVSRINDLRQCPAAIRFLSLEPLLTSLDELDLTGISLCIVGCESGPGARPMELDWVRSIRDQCQEAGVAFFFKQTMVNGKLVKLPELDGRQWTEIPDAPGEQRSDE